MTKDNLEYRKDVAFINRQKELNYLEKYSRIKEYTLTEVEGLLQDMVRNNILYFDPTEAIYYPQGKSYQWGIQLYFEGLT